MATKLGVALHSNDIIKKFSRQQRTKLTNLKTLDLYTRLIRMNLELGIANNKVLVVKKYIVIF